MLRVTNDIKTLSSLQRIDTGHTYLLGQGLYDFKKGLIRSALETGEFKVSIRLRPGINENDQEEIITTLRTLGVFGGLGSRSRKGLGSVTLQSLSCDNVQLPLPQNMAELQAAIRGLADLHCPVEPPYTAFSRFSRITLIPSASNAWETLGRVGEELQLYRSWGQNGQVGSRPAERNFLEDHDIALAAAAGEPVHEHPRRVVFGLPHNYFFSSTKNKLEIAPIHQSKHTWTNQGRNRRASPLIIHIHRFPDGNHAVVLALLSAQFLPQSDRLELKKPKAQSSRVEPIVEWSVIHDFMDRFPEREDIAL